MFTFLLDFVKKGIDWARFTLTKKQFIFVSSILVGISAGLAAVVLKLFVHFIFAFVSNNPLIDSKYFYVILPILGILFTVLIVRFFLKGKLNTGLTFLHIQIKKKSSFIAEEQMYSQIITSSVTVGFGGSAGLEAPIVLTGAAFGSNYAKTYKLNYKDRTLLLACGVAAGIAAAFNAPIAGVLFALEVLLLDVGITAFIPLIMAAASGALMSKIILHTDVLLTFDSRTPFDYFNVLFYVVLGVLAGLISVYHSRVYSKVENLFHESKLHKLWRVFIGGGILAVLILIFPSLYGEGYESIKLLSNNEQVKLLNNSLLSSFSSNEWIVLSFIGVLIFLKSIATGLTIGGGGNGGNFAPSLFVGAYLGFFMSKLINSVSHFKLPESNFTLVGMAGILSGLYHAPLTAIFLIAEITGGYTLMIPLMIVSSISFAISKYFEPLQMDIKKLAQQNETISFDKDLNILTSIELEHVIETDFDIVRPNCSLGQLVETIKHSQKNIFPVLNEEGQFKGVVLIDNIKEILFSSELYDKITVKELMITPKVLISPKDTMEIIMKKFDESEYWFLPVIEQDRFEGFISKTRMLSTYRNKLKNTILD